MQVGAGRYATVDLANQILVGDAGRRSSVLFVPVSQSTTSKQSICTVGSQRCINSGEATENNDKDNDNRNLTMRRPNQETSHETRLFSAIMLRSHWKTIAFPWWAHQGSNLGPAD